MNFPQLVNNASGFGIGGDEAAWDKSLQTDVMAAVPAPNRPAAGFLDGQMSDGAIATTIISAIANSILRSVLTYGTGS